MKHTKQKQTILNSTMGYATHKNISPDNYFKQSDEIKHHKEIKELTNRQGKAVDDEALSRNYVSTLDER